MNHPHWHDVRALEIARQFTRDDDPQGRARLQVSIVEAMGSAAPASPAAQPDGLGEGGRYWRNRSDFWMAQAIALGWREKRDTANGETDDRGCTCHPYDNPPNPCARQYAFTECVAQKTAVADRNYDFSGWSADADPVSLFDQGRYPESLHATIQAFNVLGDAEATQRAVMDTGLIHELAHLVCGESLCTHWQGGEFRARIAKLSSGQQAKHETAVSRKELMRQVEAAKKADALRCRDADKAHASASVGGELKATVEESGVFGFRVWMGGMVIRGLLDRTEANVIAQKINQAIALTATKPIQQPAVVGVGWHSPNVRPDTMLPTDATRCVIGLELYVPEQGDGGPEIRQGYFDPAFGFMDATTGMRISPSEWSSPALTPAATPGDYVMVRKEAIDWLNGETDEGFECPKDRYFRGEPPRYWWRSVFREKAGLAQKEGNGNG